MSALRYSRPGIAGTVLVDLGPAIGRASHAGVGGTMVTGVKPKPLPVAATTPERRAQMAEYRAKLAADQTCGKVMPVLNTRCARTRGHGHSCRSTETLRADAESRRAGRVPRDIRDSLR